MKDVEFDRLLACEVARDQVWASARQSEAERARGVCWSGVGPDPWTRRSEAELADAARARRARLSAWRTSAEGRFLTALAHAEDAVQAAHQSVENGRAAVSRGLDHGRAVCDAAADVLEANGRALLAAALAARRALAETAPGQ